MIIKNWLVLSKVPRPWIGFFVAILCSFFLSVRAPGLFGTHFAPRGIYWSISGVCLWWLTCTWFCSKSSLCSISVELFLACLFLFDSKYWTILWEFQQMGWFGTNFLDLRVREQFLCKCMNLPWVLQQPDRRSFRIMKASLSLPLNADVALNSLSFCRAVLLCLISIGLDCFLNFHFVIFFPWSVSPAKQFLPRHHQLKNYLVILWHIREDLADPYLWHQTFLLKVHHWLCLRSFCQL